MPTHVTSAVKSKAVGIVLSDLILNDAKACIRIGVRAAEEGAKKESARRRITAPLTIEEEIMFSIKHS